MNLQVGVKLLIRDKADRYLFLRRAPAHKAGKQQWDIPGGRINPDEPLLEALARELFEETGMRIVDEPRLIAAQDIFVPEKEFRVVRLTYVGRAEGDISLSEEHDDYEWMTKTDALADDVDPYIKEIADRF